MKPMATGKASDAQADADYFSGAVGIPETERAGGHTHRLHAAVIGYLQF